MGRYFVEISDFADFLEQHCQLLANAREAGTYPNARIDGDPDRLTRLGAVLQELQNSSLRWFYYCDNIRGNTIRIYDRFLQRDAPDLFYDRAGDPMVVLRSHEIGSAGEGLKEQILGLFETCTSVSDLPAHLGNPPRRLVERLPRDAPGRCALFESLNGRSARGVFLSRCGLGHTRLQDALDALCGGRPDALRSEFESASMTVNRMAGGRLLRATNQLDPRGEVLCDLDRRLEKALAERDRRAEDGCLQIPEEPSPEFNQAAVDALEVVVREG